MLLFFLICVLCWCLMNHMQNIFVELAAIRKELAATRSDMNLLAKVITSSYLDLGKLVVAQRVAVVEEIGQRLSKIEAAVIPPAEAEAVRLKFYLSNGGQLQEIMKMQLQAGKKASLLVKAFDQFDNETVIESPRWDLTDQAMAVVEPSADGMSAVLTSKGPIGPFQVQFAADAKIGEGETPIAGSLDIEVLPGEAVRVEISGMPEA